MAAVAAINELGSSSLNPRGNLWFNDESSYGHKLLAKMGWSKGKGLGKNENGIKENLKVKFKSTNSGLGYKDKSYADVMKTDYESILKNLSAKYPQPRTDNSTHEDVEHKTSTQKSRIKKNRIRYPKLYYGKDVSKYSEKDMKSIFICSIPLNENKVEKPEDTGSCSKKESENQLSGKYETFNSQLSISDYFNTKMKEKKDNEVKKKLNEEVKEAKGEFECSKMENTVMSSRKKCKKKKKSSEMHINMDDKNLLAAEEKEREDVIERIKQTQLSENSVSEQHFSDEKMWEMPESTDSQFNTSKKKRKRLHPKENLGNVLMSNQLHPDTLPVPKKKRKKSHTNECESVDSVEILSVVCPKYEELADIEVINNVSTSCSVENIDKNLSNNNDHCVKRSKKLKNKIKKLKSCLKSKSKKYSVKKNVSFNENVSYRIIESDTDSDSDSDSDESTDSLSDSPEKSESDETSSSDSSSEQEKNSGDNTLVIQDISLSEQNGSHSANDDSGAQEIASKEEAEESGAKEVGSKEEAEESSLSHLPSENSSYYNSWVESQKLALKMRTYKNMLKNIKKHNILKTTNLLSIKGYGNWGF